MSTVRRPLHIFNPMHKTARTIAEILAVIEAALEHDGPGAIEPGSIDTHGMTIFAGGVSYRLEIRDEEQLYPSQEAWEATAPDAFIGDLDQGEDIPF